MQLSFIDSIESINAEQWDPLFKGPNSGLMNPFISHAYLQCLEQSQSVCTKAGWHPQHLLIHHEQQLVAAMPIYLKGHSYGEYVFDWSWAEAYERAGRAYYPKLLSAIPFSPVVGPRLGVSSNVDYNQIEDLVIESIQQFAKRQQLSGWHLLFPNQQLTGNLIKKTDLLQRSDVQFHWHNQNYRQFEDFLAQMKSAKRKQIKRERRKVLEQGISVSRKTGNDITEQEWQSFYLCYRDTYYKRSGHAGYLNQQFFELLYQQLRQQLMLVVCQKDQQIVASSLFLFDQQYLYGRYWGALEDYDCLHFEACFYQGIEYCIERNLQVFNPGTQGQHKLVRGFDPVKTHSFHWFADVGMQAAVTQFLKRESTAIDQYQQQAKGYLPFKTS